MIEKILLKNFQQHSRLSLELSPTLTTLVGDSRQGKSTVLRALRFLAQGGKSTGYMKHGEDSLKVVLHVDNHKIKRVKSKTENSYQLDDKEAFRAVGMDVPEEIKELLQVSDINFQGQLDSPFWLSLSPSDAARELNKIVNLELIDKTLSNLSSSLRKANTQEELIKKRVEQQEKKLTELAWVPLAQRDWEVVEELDSEIASSRSRIARLTSLIHEGEQLASKGQGASELIADRKKLQECLDAHSVLTDREAVLKIRIEDYEKISKLKDECLLEIQTIALETQDAVCPLCGR